MPSFQEAPASEQRVKCLQVCLVYHRVLWEEPRVQDRCVQSLHFICESADPLWITKGSVAVWGTSMKLTSISSNPHSSFGTPGQCRTRPN